MSRLGRIAVFDHRPSVLDHPDPTVVGVVLSGLVVDLASSGSVKTSKVEGIRFEKVLKVRKVGLEARTAVELVDHVVVEVDDTEGPSDDRRG